MFSGFVDFRTSIGDIFLVFRWVSFLDFTELQSWSSFRHGTAHLT
jgi:hypothetical protein